MAFITHHELHEFKVMPSGDMNGAAVFQRVMQKVLSQLMAEADNSWQII